MANEGSASAAAYARLRRAIVSAELPPGTPLVETELMERYGFGRTPIREALQRLASIGLVVIFPRRGVLVPQLGLHEVMQLFEARLAIERETARLGAQRATQADLELLAHINGETHAMEDERSFPAFLEVDQRFHREVVRVARNKYLARSADQILTLNEWLWHVHLARHGVTASDYAFHDEIVDAISRGDPDAASEAMTDHIERSRALLRIAL